MKKDGQEIRLTLLNYNNIEQATKEVKKKYIKANQLSETGTQV